MSYGGFIEPNKMIIYSVSSFHEQATLKLKVQIDTLYSGKMF